MRWHAVQEQRTDQHGLAGADLTRQLHESTAFGNAVNQVRERLTMAFAHEEVTRIRRYRKRLFIETKEFRVHYFAPLSKRLILHDSGPVQGSGSAYRQVTEAVPDLVNRPIYGAGGLIVDIGKQVELLGR